MAAVRYIIQCQNLSISNLMVLHFIIFIMHSTLTEAALPIFTTGKFVKTIRQEEISKIINPKFVDSFADQEDPVLIDLAHWSSVWFPSLQAGEHEEIEIFGYDTDNFDGEYWYYKFYRAQKDESYLLTFTNKTRNTTIHEMCNENIIKPFANRLEIVSNKSFTVIDSDTFFSYLLHEGDSLILELPEPKKHREHVSFSLLVDYQSMCNLTLAIQTRDNLSSINITANNETEMCKLAEVLKKWKTFEKSDVLNHRTEKTTITLTSSSGDCNIANITIKHHNEVVHPQTSFGFVKMKQALIQEPRQESNATDRPFNNSATKICTSLLIIVSLRFAYFF